jgi:hypothetical protein
MNGSKATQLVICRAKFELFFTLKVLFDHAELFCIWVIRVFFFCYYNKIPKAVNFIKKRDLFSS